MYHFIIGTKAQLVKIAPVIRAFEQIKLDYEVVLTGQHKETMDELLLCFEINKFNITLYDHSEADSIFKLFKWMIGSSKAFFLMRKKLSLSDGFIIHGDTLSTLIGAIWAKLIGVKVIHIEAGLRSDKLFRPFPEEIVRKLVTKLSNILFCPNQWAVNNISNLSRKKLIINTYQNTLLDSIRFAVKKNYQLESKSESNYIIASVHRTENVMKKEHFLRIIELIKIASKKYPIKLILHPITRRKIDEYNLKEELRTNNIETIPRVDYVSFVKLLSNSIALLSDGGSNQEESSYLELPCLVLRKETERLEGIGKNVTVSNLDPNIVRRFIANINNSNSGIRELPKGTPSDLISKSLLDLTK